MIHFINFFLFINIYRITILKLGPLGETLTHSHNDISDVTISESMFGN